MIAAPFPSGPYTVRPEWIDYNGHMNMAYYVLIFDRATDELWEALGIGSAAKTEGHSTFAAESHILYRSELMAGDSVNVQSVVLGADAKRLHVAHEMRRATDGSVAAQQELMFLSVALSTRRVTPFPAEALARVLRAAEAHAAYPRPDWVGRRVAMPSRA